MKPHERIQQARRRLQEAVAAHHAATSNLSVFSESEQRRRLLEAQGALRQAVEQAAALADAAGRDAAAEIEDLDTRLDWSDVFDILPPGAMTEASRRAGFIREDMETMQADMLTRRLRSVIDGNDAVGKVLHVRYVQRRLERMAEAGQLAFDLHGRPVVPAGASAHEGKLAEVVQQLRASLDGPEQQIARRQAEAVRDAAGDLAEDVVRLQFDVERYGQPGMALSR